MPKYGGFDGGLAREAGDTHNLEDGPESVDEIVDEFLRETPPRFVRAAAEGGRRVLSAGHDEQALAARLDGMGLWLLPEPVGFASFRTLAEHLVERLAQGVADAPNEALDDGSEADR